MGWDKIGWDYSVHLTCVHQRKRPIFFFLESESPLLFAFKHKRSIVPFQNPKQSVSQSVVC